MSKWIKFAFPAFGCYRTIISDIPNIQTSKIYQDHQRKPALGHGTGWSKNRAKILCRVRLCSRLFAKLRPHFLARLQDTFTLYRSKGVETCRGVARCCYSLYASYKLNIQHVPVICKCFYKLLIALCYWNNCGIWVQYDVSEGFPYPPTDAAWRALALHCVFQICLSSLIFGQTYFDYLNISVCNSLQLPRTTTVAGVADFEHQRSLEAESHGLKKIVWMTSFILIALPTYNFLQFAKW